MDSSSSLSIEDTARRRREVLDLRTEPQNAITFGTQNNSSKVSIAPGKVYVDETEPEV